MTIKFIGTTLLTTALLLSLTACGGGKAPETTPPETTPEQVETIAPVKPEVTPEIQPESQPEPAPEVDPFTNPLTGETGEVELASDRPVAIMLNNLKKALPQAGISQADVIYEIPVEGGITRMMALFQSLDGIEEIGTVRSARDYYVSLAVGHDAVFFHAGGSPQAYTALQEWKVDRYDGVNGPYGADLFWRDAQRKAKAGTEHSMMTSAESIVANLSSSSLRTEHNSNFNHVWTFTSEAATGETANTITVPFSTLKNTVFTYDSATGNYLVNQYNAPYVDANDGQQVSVKNVLVLYTDVDPIPGDTAGRLTIRTTGKGSGILARDGVMQEITWKRDSRNDMLHFYDAAGDKVALSVGSSYINILDSGISASWE